MRAASIGRTLSDRIIETVTFKGKIKETGREIETT
jgi:hypothetical protein